MEMLEANLEYFGDPENLNEILFAGPEILRPKFFSETETPKSRRDVVADADRLKSFLARAKSGYFLLGKGLTYSIRRGQNGQNVCDCFLQVDSVHVKALLLALLQLKPEFSFGCLPAEREYRNLISQEVGGAKIDAWVGRSINRQLPGLYWLTTISESLANKHSVPLSQLAQIACDHEKHPGGIHFFQFYDLPEQWSSSIKVVKAVASIEGIFDIDSARKATASARNLLDFQASLAPFK